MISRSRQLSADKRNCHRPHIITGHYLIRHTNRYGALPPTHALEFQFCIITGTSQRLIKAIANCGFGRCFVIVVVRYIVRSREPLVRNVLYSWGTWHYKTIWWAASEKRTTRSGDKEGDGEKGALGRKDIFMLFNLFLYRNFIHKIYNLKNNFWALWMGQGLLLIPKLVSPIYNESVKEVVDPSVALKLKREILITFKIKNSSFR